MSWGDFLVIFLACAATMLVCRVAPLFALKGRELSPRAESALNLIAPAAFAALVANDLLGPSMFDGGLWPGLRPLVAACLVFIVGKKTKSLVWCIVGGVGSYAVMMLV